MSTGLTFFQARAICQMANLHVRRSGWTDPNQWFLCWRGVWWFFTTDVVRPVQAGDYSAVELLATDWTTMPAALAACPVDASIGSTGGGVDYGTLLGGIEVNNGAGTAGTLLGGGSYSGGLPSGGGGSPATTPTSDVSVTFASIVQSSASLAIGNNINVNQTVPLSKAGTGEWQGSFTSGTNQPSGNQGITWTVIATRTGSDPKTATWSVALSGNPSNGMDGTAFGTANPGMPRGTPIPNALVTGSWTGGTAIIN